MTNPQNETTVGELPNGAEFRSRSGTVYRRLGQDFEFSGAINVLELHTGRKDVFAKCAAAYPVENEAADALPE